MEHALLQYKCVSTYCSTHNIGYHIELIGYSYNSVQSLDHNNDMQGELGSYNITIDNHKYSNWQYVSYYGNPIPFDVYRYMFQTIEPDIGIQIITITTQSCVMLCSKAYRKSVGNSIWCDICQQGSYTGETSVTADPGTCISLHGDGHYNIIISGRIYDYQGYFRPIDFDFTWKKSKGSFTIHGFLHSTYLYLKPHGSTTVYIKHMQVRDKAYEALLHPLCFWLCSSMLRIYNSVGSSYSFYSLKTGPGITWFEANEICRRNGSHLASFHSWKDMDLLDTLFLLDNPYIIIYFGLYSKV